MDKDSWVAMIRVEFLLKSLMSRMVMRELISPQDHVDVFTDAVFRLMEMAERTEDDELRDSYYEAAQFYRKLSTSIQSGYQRGKLSEQSE